MSYNAHELSNRLLNALDSNYNVVDMQAVNEIISILEKFNITKELLETTRLGKHVNELRRKTSDPTLARRAKVLVKRWRDLVIPAVASPAHAGSNRSSAERSTRRPGGTPLTSPALIRQGLSPAVPSPRLPSRPAWGGYESDSQDVILVDDDPPPPPVPTHAHKPATPPVKRALTPESVDDDKKAKRDKKPKKRRGHGRAGSGVETTIPAVPGVPQTPAGIPNTTATPGANNAWPARNGSGPERRKNGWRRDKPDPYAALVNRIPPSGGKKVKTTAELLEQIQSRTGGKASAPPSPNSPHSPDVMLIEPDEPPVSVDSPLRNGESEAPREPQWLLEPLEDEREWAPCICDPDVGPDPACPADSPTIVQPEHVHALHHAFLPGVNGTRAPLHPHKFAVRPSIDPNDPSLFATVVPLYNYSDYANDFCVKNMSRLPLCRHIPATEFAPSPPSPPPRPPPPSPRPYPIEDIKAEDESSSPSLMKTESEMEIDIKPEINERLKPSPTQNVDKQPTIEVKEIKEEPQQQFSVTSPGHRTVERTKENNEGLSDPIEDKMDLDVKEEKVVQKVLESPTFNLDGRTLYENCVSCVNSVPFRYENASCAPVLTFPREDVSDSVNNALESIETERDEIGRPVKATHFAEWHECAKLGDLIALPYVVID
ncbi:unnamed protein product [Pieris brassicae]|uniref:Mediator of RNA polymerase II transcription subunit 26 n=1 Tax=Pieris brassicae TaxID=7116 RepID=A0A9P0TI58_PIEBR|nr:unnamed protein product [Pieris brassicae]